MSAQALRMRIDEINKELGRLSYEIEQRKAKGKPVSDLERKKEELERRKHELVEQMGALWSA